MLEALNYLHSNNVVHRFVGVGVGSGGGGGGGDLRVHSVSVI